MVEDCVVTAGGDWRRVWTGRDWDELDVLLLAELLNQLGLAVIPDGRDKHGLDAKFATAIDDVAGDSPEGFPGFTDAALVQLKLALLWSQLVIDC